MWHMKLAKKNIFKIFVWLKFEVYFWNKTSKWLRYEIIWDFICTHVRQQVLRRHTRHNYQVTDDNLKVIRPAGTQSSPHLLCFLWVHVGELKTKIFLYSGYMTYTCILFFSLKKISICKKEYKLGLFDVP